MFKFKHNHINLKINFSKLDYTTTPHEGKKKKRKQEQMHKTMHHRQKCNITQATESQWMNLC